MKLEQQLAKLAQLGLTLNEGISIDDLLYSFRREEYEEQPFDLILFVIGIEVERAPWERAICSRVWNFDMECIGATGDYVRIVKQLCVVAGQPEYLSEISDFVDLDAGSAWLKYRVHGIARHWSIEVNSDWADLLTLVHVMVDIEHDNRRFFSKNNGQALILFYLDAATAAELNRLSQNALEPVHPS